MSTRGDCIARTARSFVGCSLSNRRGELAALVATSPDDDPRQLVQVKTNCGMFARGVMARCGVVHPVLEQRYRIGYAVSDVLEVAKRHGALAEFEAQPLKRGTILHYTTPGLNNDHVEILLEDTGPEFGWNALHCGGGRAENAVTESRSDVRKSSGRPLQHVIDPDLLLEPI